MTGHLFLCHGDLTQTACDVRLVPTNRRFIIEPYWKVPQHLLPKDIAFPHNTRTVTIAHTTPILIFTDLGGDLHNDIPPIQWYLHAAKEFLQQAAAVLSNTHIKFRRPKHLIALPLIGTGKGGAGHDAGIVLRELIPILTEFAANSGIDIQLVLKGFADFGAAQCLRNDLAQQTQYEWIWNLLSPSQKQIAKQLAHKAVCGELALFLGAGVSMGAGLPLWGALLKKIAQDAGFNESEIEALERLGYLDAASLLENRVGNIGQVAADAVKSDFYSLQHGLLASLPVAEVITTNYDDLFERARQAAFSPITVIPKRTGSFADATSWLLKMHGDVAYPPDIVLSRDHYMFYEESRGALVSMVQAMLLTKHMLFVGFSLTDYNFHKIMSSVRYAFKDAKRKHFASALMLIEDKMMTELWKEEVQLIWMKESGPLSEGGRQLEIFLDYLISNCIQVQSYIANPRYQLFLKHEDRIMLEFLQKIKSIANEHRQTDSCKLLLKFLANLGFEEKPELKVDTIGLSKFSSQLFPEDMRKIEIPSPSTPSIDAEKKFEYSNAEEKPLEKEKFHLFICRGDIRVIACDAWLFPSGNFYMPRSWKVPDSLKHSFGTKTSAPGHRLRHAKGLQKRVYPRYLDGNELRVKRVDDWPEDRGKPYVTIGASQLGDLIEAVKQFLYTAHADIVRKKEKAPLFGRHNHIFALPVLGTRFGGFRKQTGEVLYRILELLSYSVRVYQVDIVLVCYDEQTYVSAQIGRLKLFENPWKCLSESNILKAAQLGQRCLSDDLVLFFGGFGASRVVSTIESVALDLARDLGFNNSEIGQLKPLSLVDRLKIIQNRFPNEQEYTAAVLKKLRTDSVPLFHFLLTQMQVHAAITTNVDSLYETACLANGVPLAVLPNKAAEEEKEDRTYRSESFWLMKYNGCQSDPNSLTLTREKFVRLRSQRYAIGSILQALLITKHLVFFGSSLDDRVFHRALDEVLKVVSPQDKSKPLCTFVTHLSNSFAEILWSPRVDFVSIGEHFAEEEAEGLRRLEIFMDCVCAMSVESRIPVLDGRFESILSDEELQVRRKLMPVAQELVESDAVNSSLFTDVLKLLRSLGYGADLFARHDPPVKAVTKQAMTKSKP